MTVFVAHAPADSEAAEGLEKFLERRGQFVERDDGQTALRPIQPSDVFVLLVSEQLASAPSRLRLEQRALDAWTEQRLILVKLDKAAASIGLRDLRSIDASAEASRNASWQEVATVMGEMLARQTAQVDSAESVLATEPPPPSKARRTVLGGLLLALLALPGIGAAAATGAIWLVNRIGPSPGTFEDLRRGIDQFGLRYGAPPGVAEWLFVISILITFGVLAFFIARIFAPRAKPATKSAAVSPPPAQGAPVAHASKMVVTYADANAKDVLPLIEAAKAAAPDFVIDNEKADAVEPAERVRAIQSARGLLVLCSKAAFESDRVKRDIYLADRYQKKLTPVSIEEAEPPQDFAYFLAGAQALKLFQASPADRPQALLSALGSNP